MKNDSTYEIFINFTSSFLRSSASGSNISGVWVTSSQKASG